MIGTALAIYSMATGMVASIKARQAAQEAQRKLTARKNELDLEYKYDSNLDFLNTPMAKSALSQLSQEYIRNARKVAQSNVITGASDEKAVAQAESMQRPFVGAITNLAGYGQERQDALRREHLASENSLFGLDYNQSMQKSANLMNAGSNAMGAAGAFSMADSYGAFNKGDEWLKGLFKNKPGATFQNSGNTAVTFR
jgi:hypothetical protein